MVLADTTSGLGQYGALGIISALLLSAILWFAKQAVSDQRAATERERARADRLEAENQRLNGLIIDRVIPALTSVSNAAEQSAELLRASQRERERRERRAPKGGDD